VTMWLPLTYFFVACQADEVDSLLQKQQLLGVETSNGCNQQELFALIGELPNITKVLNTVKEFGEEYSEWPPTITFVEAITQHIADRSKKLQEDADKCAAILHNTETDQIQQITSEVEDLLVFAMKTFKVAHPTPVVPTACLKEGQKIDLTVTPRSIVAWIRVPKNLGNERVGVIAGSFAATHAINWEIHDYGKPRLWWDGGKADWIMDLNMRDGQLHQVAWVVNSARTQASFYVDGILRGTHSDTYSEVLPRGPTYYGRDYRTSLAFKNKGDLYDVVISDKELSRSQLSTIGQDHCS